MNIKLDNYRRMIWTWLNNFECAIDFAILFTEINLITKMIIPYHLISIFFDIQSV